MKKTLKKNGLKLDQITIDPELKKWLPPLDQQEMGKLIKSIKKEGQRHPLALWQNDGKTVLVDGHHRLKVRIPVDSISESGMIRSCRCHPQAWLDPSSPKVRPVLRSVISVVEAGGPEEARTPDLRVAKTNKVISSSVDH